MQLVRVGALYDCDRELLVVCISTPSPPLATIRHRVREGLLLACHPNAGAAVIGNDAVVDRRRAAVAEDSLIATCNRDSIQNAGIGLHHRKRRQVSIAAQDRPGDYRRIIRIGRPHGHRPADIRGDRLLTRGHRSAVFGGRLDGSGPPRHRRLRQVQDPRRARGLGLRGPRGEGAGARRCESRRRARRPSWTRPLHVHRHRAAADGGQGSRPSPPVIGIVDVRRRGPAPARNDSPAAKGQRFLAISGHS